MSNDLRLAVARWREGETKMQDDEYYAIRAQLGHAMRAAAESGLDGNFPVAGYQYDLSAEDVLVWCEG
jgi:hypothetical protein